VLTQKSYQSFDSNVITVYYAAYFKGAQPKPTIANEWGGVDTYLKQTISRYTNDPIYTINTAFN
jgi:hypothetical protein